MEGEVIKSFLVGLGFGVDDASLSKFNKAIASATLKVTALYTAVNAAASGIVFGISKISEASSSWVTSIGLSYRPLTRRFFYDESFSKLTLRLASICRRPQFPHFVPILASPRRSSH